MLKNILLLSTFFCVGFISAQSFELLDANDVDISITSHYEYGEKEDLGLTKFHVRNLLGTQAAFAVKVEKVYVPYSNSSLAVCFGLACFSADATVDGTQIINNGVGDNVNQNTIYTDLKVAPITWPWGDCEKDSAVWKMTVYDPANISDEVTATIVWRCGYPVTVEALSEDIVTLTSFPNPALAHLKINYKIEAAYSTASIEFYDMLGQELVSEKLVDSKGQVQLDVRPFNAGIYFYAIKVDGQTVKTERVVVK